MINPGNWKPTEPTWLVNGKSCQVVLTGTWNCKISKSPRWSFAPRWEGIVLMGNNKDLKVGRKKGLIVRGSDLLQFILWWERNFLLFSAGHLFQERTICNLSQEIGALQRIWNPWEVSWDLEPGQQSILNFPARWILTIFLYFGSNWIRQSTPVHT